MHQKENRQRPKISVIIPAYNEEDRLGNTLAETSLFFSAKPYITEIIVVDDGSTDKTTRLVMKSFNDKEMRKFKNIKPYLKRHPKNMGKGAAISTGIKAASGVHVLLIDSDGATPISEFDKLYREIGHAPVVIGSRDIGTEDRTLQSSLRKTIGSVAKFVTRILFGLPVTDTQCGFKLIESRIAKDLAHGQKTLGFGYDVEYLAKAHKKGYAIKEIGIRWHDKAGGKVRPVRDSLVTFIDLLKIRKNL